MRSRSALLLALVACKGNSAVPLDSHPVIDADIDASDESARVEVIVNLGDGTFDPDAIAIFRDPSGSVIQHGKVDATTGIAFADMPLGGDVLVLRAKDDPQNAFRRNVRITQIRGVKPGDRLEAGIAKWHELRTGIETYMQAGFTSIGSGAPAMLTACAENGISQNPRTLIFYPSCTPTGFDLVAIQDEAGTNVRKYVTMDNVPYVKDGTFTIPNTWQAMPLTTTTFTNVPSNMTRVFAEAYVLVDGTPYKTDQQAVELPPSTCTTSLLHVPNGVPGLIIGHRIQESILDLDRYAVVTNTPATETIDFAAQPLPRSPIPSFNAVTQSQTGLSWTEVGTGAPDARVALWASEWVDANNVRRITAIEIVEPAVGTSTTIPTLPAPYTADDPNGHVNQLRTAAAYYVDYDVFAGYDDARQLGTSVMAIEHTLLSTPHRAHLTAITR